MFYEFVIGLTDVYVAGRVGKDIQATYGFVVQQYFILIVVANALTVGTVSVVSRLFTSGNKNDLSEAVFSSLIFSAAAGIALATLGIGALQSGGSDLAGLSLRALAGCLLALGAAASESVFNLLGKRVPATIGPRLASAVVMAMALLILGALSIASGEKIEWESIGLERFLAFAYMGLFSSALAYILFFTGVARLPVSTVGVFSGFMPLSSFALSLAFLGERPRAATFAGSALAIAGIALCAAGTRRRPAALSVEEAAS
jgi:drug/metabolite transporter (DMT)-like permease